MAQKVLYIVVTRRVDEFELSFRRGPDGNDGSSFCHPLERKSRLFRRCHKEILAARAKPMGFEIGKSVKACGK